MAEAKQGYVDRPEVAETFADHCERVIFDGQTLRVDLSVTRYGEPTPDKRATAHRATACRLVMTPQSALQLHDQLQRVVDALEEKGLVKKRASNAPTKQ
jgi:uncharacterized protein (DUF1786 family)